MENPHSESPQKVVTIRDIAVGSGFSNATVSMALRNHPSISEKTRQLVREVADRMGYRANPLMAAHWEAVRSRKPPGFRSVIAILNDWESAPSMGSYPWLAPVYAALRDRANALGYLTEEFSIVGEQIAGMKRASAPRAQPLSIFGFKPCPRLTSSRCSGRSGKSIPPRKKRGRNFSNGFQRRSPMW